MITEPAACSTTKYDVSHDGSRRRPGPWAIERVAETGSTNADLVLAAGRGAAHGTVLVADLQVRGRGRLGRSWQAPAGTSLMFSVLLRLPRVPIARQGWVGAILGLAVVDAIRETTGLVADLKWPNDVLIEGRKAAGILAELAGNAVIVGAGINVLTAAADLPRADATSLVLSGADPSRCDRAALLDAILHHLGLLIERWERADGDIDASGIRAKYLQRCASIGADVSVHLPDGSTVSGTAIDVHAEGSIVVDDGHRIRRFSAGDVQHLRVAGAAPPVGSPHPSHPKQ